MSVIKSDPFFGSIFGDAAPLVRMQTPDWPAMKTGLSMDMKETPKAFVATVDIPGLSKDDIHISCEDDILTISADYKREVKKEDERHHWQERHSGHVSRSIRLPEHVEMSGIEANQKDGILTITIPKRAQESKKKAHRIHVK